MQGFLLLNKPKGITSFGAVSKVKWLCGEKRVGHTGTLDPMATGVLPIFIGKATSLSSHLLDADKTYIARIKLGVITDTLDITGKVLKINNVTVTHCDIEKTLTKFVGKISQTPPMYSALKKDGVRLYDLARNGETVEIPERNIEIFNISILKPLDENMEFEISAKVSKGTYIRSLARDIGEDLGCGATLTGLSRINASGFDIEDCVDLDKLTRENIGEYIMNEEKAIGYLDAVNVTEKQAIRFTNGGQLSFERLNKKDFFDGQLIRVKYNDLFLGLGVADLENNQLAIKCVINKI